MMNDTDDSVVETHTLSVSQAGALRMLRTQFTSSTTFLSELLQNARRAGATAVRITWDPDGSILTVTDNGEGIRRFLNLFIAYESGWDAVTKTRERPNGVGIYASLDVSEWIEIHSLGQRATLDQKLFEFKPVTVHVAPRRQGTEVRLRLLEAYRRTIAEWSKLLHEMVAGFPIPVWFGGAQIPRPHALDSGLSFRHTELGELHLPGWEACRVPREVKLPVMYYQGLRIHRVGFEPTGEFGGRGVLHLDTERFPAVGPNRFVLHQADRQEPIILNAIRGQWQQRLAERRSELSAEVFTDEHWTHCVRLGVPELLRDMPLTRSMLKAYIKPRRMHGCDKIFDSWGSRALPPAGAVLIPQWSGCDFDGRPTLASLYAIARDWPVLDNRVPRCHPASERVVSLDDERLGLYYEMENPGMSGQFSGRCVACKVQTCDAYTVRFRPDPRCGLTEQQLAQLTPVKIDHWAFYDRTQNCIVVPAKDGEVSRVLSHLSDYEEDDQWMEWEYEEDYDHLTDIVASFRARSPAAYVLALLDGIVPDPVLLKGCAFRLRYEEDGRGWNVEQE